MSLSLKYFVEAYQPTQRYSFADELAEQYLDRLPDSLREHWQSEGLASYGDGIVWFINPNDYEGIRKLWLASMPHAVIFARNAFGDMFAFNDDKIVFVNVHYARLQTSAASFENYFNTILTGERYAQQLLHKDLFAEALHKLGKTEVDEMYTFVPALALGGAEEIDYIEKVKLKVQLHILAQLHG